MLHSLFHTLFHSQQLFQFIIFVHFDLVLCKMPAGMILRFLLKNFYQHTEVFFTDKRSNESPSDPVESTDQFF